MSLATVPPQEAFRRNQPVDLMLAAIDGTKALYIVDADDPGQDLRLALENRSDAAFWLMAPASPDPSASNYHVELRFRPGVLDRQHADEVHLITTHRAGDDSYHWSLTQQENADGTVSLFLLRNEAEHVRPGERVNLTLSHLRAASDGGSRPTQVELILRKQPGQSRRFTRADSHRIQPMRIVRRRGEPKLPLLAAFRGSDTILNDGDSANELTLELINTGHLPLRFDATSLDVPTLFVLSSAATHDRDPRALASASDLAVMQVGVDSPGWLADVDDEGQLPEWTIRPQQAVVLLPGQAIVLQLTNLVSDAPSGTAELRVRYSNVPGHWDGELAVAIHKSPLLFRDVLNEFGRTTGAGQIGIRTAKPGLDLAIGDGGTGLQQQGDNELAFYTKGVERVRISGSGRVGIRASAPSIDLAIGDNDTGLQQQSNGELAFFTKGRERVRISDAGRVGIRAMWPTIDLAIGDNDTGLQQEGDGELAFRTSGYERIRVGATGKVGIGTTAPAIDLAVGAPDSGMGLEDGRIALYSEGVPKLKVDAAGRVQIDDLLFGGLDADQLALLTKIARGGEFWMEISAPFYSGSVRMQVRP